MTGLLQVFCYVVDTNSTSIIKRKRNPRSNLENIHRLVQPEYEKTTNIRSMKILRGIAKKK